MAYYNHSMKDSYGRYRPANPFESGSVVARIATGEIKEDIREPSQKHKGGKARAKALPASKRKDIAKKAAKTRWE